MGGKVLAGAASWCGESSTPTISAQQITYDGHPLYYYVSDQSSGETTGEGINSFGAVWYVLDPQGNKIANP